MIVFALSVYVCVETHGVAGSYDRSCHFKNEELYASELLCATAGKLREGEIVYEDSAMVDALSGNVVRSVIVSFECHKVPVVGDPA